MPYLVLGAGMSGNAAAALLRAEGAAVEHAPRTRGGAAAEEFAARCCGGGAGAGGAALTVVASPGIPPRDAEIMRARSLGMRVIGEMQLGVSRFGGRVIAVTGSKGKSSLVKLIAETLALSGVRAVPCGNYGLAMCAVVAQKPQPQVAVLECSSFQLEYGPMSPGADAACILNVQPDHLDRHGGMEAYAAAKAEIFGNTRAGALRLSPGDLAEPERAGDAALWRGSYFDNAVLRPAAVAAVRLLRGAAGLADGAIAAGFAAFHALPHRMQRVAESGGVVFVDDSKATSLSALAAAVRMSAPPVFLIAGGRLKEEPPRGGKYLLESGAGKAYLIGECAEKLADAWRGDLPVEISGVLGAAVRAASADAWRAGGGTVLFSPGAASYDQFKNYEERGDSFAAAARNLTNQNTTEPRK